MNIQLNQEQADLLLHLLQMVDGRVQYADVQDQINNLLNQVGGAV